MDSREDQERINLSTRGHWDFFSGHRQHVTHHIARLANGLDAPSIAILGAGNGNDIEYAKLCKHFQFIHLFDFDSVSLEHLRSQQMAELPEGQVIFEPEVELSGVVNQIESLSGSTTDLQIANLIETARKNSLPLAGRQFDVVVSACMLTQLLDTVAKNAGDEGKYKNEIMIALRDGHLRLMTRLLKPRGKGLLVTDFVSSDTLPELTEAKTGEQVLEVSRAAIERRNFFTGTNPWAIKESLATMLAEVPSSPWSIAPPWRWQIGAERFYLVTAIEFSKQF
jgi:hypothetical protein